MWTDAPWSLIVASCLPSMQLNTGVYYTIRFKVKEGDDKREVLYAHCSCVVGRGQDDAFADCKHAAALFFCINKSQTYSQTDHQMSWKQPSKKKLELYPHGKTYESLYEKTRGHKRNYQVIDEVALSKFKRLMEKHFDDLDQRGLYKMIDTSYLGPSNPIPSSVPEAAPAIHKLIEQMILKPLPYIVPEEITRAFESLEALPLVRSLEIVNLNYIQRRRAARRARQE